MVLTICQYGNTGSHLSQDINPFHRIITNKMTDLTADFSWFGYFSQHFGVIWVNEIFIDFEPDESNDCIRIQASARTIDQTGVEMEALTAVSAAALTVYDMCKSYDRDMTISDIRLLEKSGGKSGIYKRKQE